MPTNFTENFDLSQWERTDKVQMEDFNADNAKVDAALASHAALLAGKGNCKIWTGSYKGTGTYGSGKSTSFTFPALPLFALVIGSDGDMMPLIPGWGSTVYHAPGDGGRNNVSWSGNTAAWTASIYPSAYSQMNASGHQYRVFAFYQADQA